MSQQFHNLRELFMVKTNTTLACELTSENIGYSYLRPCPVLAKSPLKTHL